MRISDWSSDVCSSDLVPADADSQTCASGALARAWLPSRRGKVRMPSVLTAIPFVATHQLVIFGVGCVFGHQFGGEAARSRQPVARRLGAMVRGDAREIGGRDAVALARGIDRGDRKSTRLHYRH